MLPKAANHLNFCVNCRMEHILENSLLKSILRRNCFFPKGISFGMATAREINTHRGEGGDLDKGLEVLQLAGLMEILPQPSQRQRHILRTPQMKTSINTTTSEQKEDQNSFLSLV